MSPPRGGSGAHPLGAQTRGLHSAHRPKQDLLTGPDAVRRLLALFEREHGAPLGPAAQAELAAIVAQARQSNGMDLFDGREEMDCVARREVTILLADLRGFTALSATLAAGDVIRLLNRCLAVLSEVVFCHQGVIDKFMGDSIMVLFGVPRQCEDDVPRALACAIEMQLAMNALNDEHQRTGMPALYMGIGINTGEVMAGRFGSDAYSAYTVIGDEVNLVSRIEAFSLRGQVLISESTYQRSGGGATATAPMEVYVKGRSRPVLLRELIALPARGLQVPRQELRRSHRVQVRLPCEAQLVRNKIVVPHRFKACVRDIGYYGLQLEREHPLALHVDVKLEFDLPLIDYRVTDIYAKVIKCKREGGLWVAGLEFTSISGESNARIQMFVQLMVGAQ